MKKQNQHFILNANLTRKMPLLVAISRDGLMHIWLFLAAVQCVGLPQNKLQCPCSWRWKNMSPRQTVWLSDGFYYSFGWQWLCTELYQALDTQTVCEGKINSLLVLVFHGINGKKKELWKISSDLFPKKAVKVSIHESKFLNKFKETSQTVF